MAQKLQGEVERLDSEVSAQGALIKEIASKQDQRHEENQRAIYSRVDRGDLQRLEDQVRDSFKELKQMITQAAR